MNLFISYRNRTQPLIARGVANYATTEEKLIVAYSDGEVKKILLDDIWWFRCYEEEKCGQPSVVDSSLAQSDSRPLKRLGSDISFAEPTEKEFDGKKHNHLLSDEAGIWKSDTPVKWNVKKDKE